MQRDFATLSLATIWLGETRLPKLYNRGVSTSHIAATYVKIYLYV